jgi:hypothetical protein
LNSTDEAAARAQVAQRISPRIPVEAPASVTWRRERLAGFVESINLAGMYVAAPRVPDIGDYVDLVFSLPRGRRSFRVRASVVHTRPRDHRAGFGARFERPPLGFLEAIKAL